VAAPTETRTPNLHRAKIAHRECGWKDGDSGDSAGEKPCPTKKQKNPLDSERPSHGRRFHALRGSDRKGDYHKLAARYLIGSSNSHFEQACNSVVFQWSVAAHCTCAGRDTVKVVPMPGELFSSIFPLCWRMIPKPLDSPSPVPLPSGLVVKNGSKIAD
jgi:hypothetical protein